MTNFNDPWGKGFNSNNGNGPNHDFESLKNLLKKILKGGNPKVFFIIPVIFFCAWMLSGFYMVNPEQQGVELIFGKYTQITDSGLNYNLPYPVGEVNKLNVTSINKEEIGLKLDSNGRSQRKNQNSTEKSEGVILTGDENIINVNFEVMWKIYDPYKYLYSVREDRKGKTIKSAAESAARESIGLNSIGFILSGNGRSKISSEIFDLLQHTLDSYDMGVKVVSIQLKKIDPPEKVISSFRDVQSARADREVEINKAQSYQNDIMPRARGEAQKILREAEAYKHQVLEKAIGDSSRFIYILEQYKKAPSLMKKKMYLEHMEEILAPMDKIIFDNNNGNLLGHFPVYDSSVNKYGK